MTDKEFSDKTQREAEELLASTNVLGVLSAHGDVRVGGSFASRLMWGPDIDITVACAEPRTASMSVLDDFVQGRNFQKYQYGDFEKFKREKRPEAFIVVLMLPYEGRKWEVEIWFHKEHPKERADWHVKLESLTSEQKKDVLRLKREREEGGVDKHALSSVEIYQRVLGS